MKNFERLTKIFRMRAYAIRILRSLSMVAGKAPIFILVLWTGFVFSERVAAKPHIISGYDDVIRQANNTGLLSAALKIFETDKAFAGMCELYSVISANEMPPAISLVSAISNWFDGRVDHLLAQNNCPSNRRYLRNWLAQWSIQEFKLANLKEIILSRPDRNFIVIFDNSDASIELTDRIHAEFSDRVVAIYLRQVVAKKMPSSAQPFSTAFDIAMNEYKAGRLSAREASKVADVILAVKEKGDLFPSYALCNPQISLCSDGPQDLFDICVQVKAHLQEICHDPKE